MQHRVLHAPRRLSAVLALVCLSGATALPARAQHAGDIASVPASASRRVDETTRGTASAPASSAAAESRPRRIAPLLVREVPNGTRVRVTSDEPLSDYLTTRDGQLFTVRIPRASARQLQEGLRGAGVSEMKMRQAGPDILYTFVLPEGVSARTEQSFNRLDIFFEQQQGSGTASGATPAATPQTNGPATPPPAPANESQPAGASAQPSASAGDTQPSGSMAAQDTPHVAKGRTVPPEKARPISIVRFEKAPVIDGKLDDDVWQTAAVFKDFYQIEPGDNVAPSKPTEVRAGYDSKFLYLAFHAIDEPDKVRATVAKRDSIFDDDHVGVFLDTFNDQRRAYEFFFNPFGIQADGIMSTGDNEDFSLDVVMESKGTLTADGYTVEIAIPFKSLRYEAGKGKLWGIHFLRRIKRMNNELSSWMPISRDVAGLLVQEGKITGIEGVSTERTLELIPSITVSETGRRVRAVPPVPSPGRVPDPTGADRFLNRPLAADIGVTTKFGITPTVTLDFAYNPDFAQVEADQTVVTANQRFPIFFAEKRPFFLEGIEIFNTYNSVVHTRAIIDPDYAVKLTGKRGRNTFGFILASDDAPGNFSEEERADPDRREEVERLFEKNALIGVLRLKRDVGRESSVGLFATTYNFPDRINHLGGLDARFKLDPQTYLAVEVVGTKSRTFFRNLDSGGSDLRNGNGFAYAYELDNTGRNFGYRLNGDGRTRDYRADVGFTRQTNTNNHSFGFRLSTTPNPKAKLIEFRFQNFTQAQFDWKGRLQGWVDGTNFNFNMAKQTFLQIGTNFGYERIFEEEFGRRRTLTHGGTFAGDDSERQTRQKTIFFVLDKTFSKQYSAFVFMGTRRGIFDFDFGAGPRFPRVSPVALVDPDAPLDPGSANSLDIEAGVTYQPTNALRTSLNYTKARLTRRDTGLVAFDDNIFAFRSTYQFTRFTFARARVDYGTLSSSLRAQLLFGWTPNPGTALYVGYNDDLNHNGFNPFTGQLEPGFRRNGRTFFIKAAYLIRHSF